MKVQIRLLQYVNPLWIILLFVYIESKGQVENVRYSNHKKIIYDGIGKDSLSNINEYKIYDEYFISDTSWKLVTFFDLPNKASLYSEKKIYKSGKDYIFSSNVYRAKDSLLLYKSQGLLEKGIVPDFHADWFDDISAASTGSAYSYFETFFTNNKIGSSSIFDCFSDGIFYYHSIGVTSLNINLVGFKDKKEVYFFPIENWDLYSYQGKLLKHANYKIIPFKRGKYVDYYEKIQSVIDGYYLNTKYDGVNYYLVQEAYYKSGKLEMSINYDLENKNNRIRFINYFEKGEEAKIIWFKENDNSIQEIWILNEQHLYNKYYPNMKIKVKSYKKFEKEKDGLLKFWKEHRVTYDENGKILEEY